jgi:(E)-4-hydroxy-3-methyl-but-2-enyl pyrophosphate reductase
MKIIVSKHHGPCCGVRRALDIAFDIIERKKENVYSFGPLIHNPQVVSKLSEKGIKVIEKLDNIKKGTIIIRTHGIPREIKEEMKKKNLEVIDATCPIVAKVQKIVTELTEKKYKVIIIGKKEHPEVKALVSYANEPIILNSVDEAISLPKMSKCGVVGQTTILFENFKNIVSLLLDKSYELKIYNTLCKETSEDGA